MSDAEHVNGTTEFEGTYDDDASHHAEMDHDVEMTDAATHVRSTFQPHPHTTNTDEMQPGAVEESPASPSATAATPETLPLAGGQHATPHSRSQSQSRAHSPASRSSLHPGAATAMAQLPPTLLLANNHPGGSPARAYLNRAVTPSLLEGMKLLAAQEPERPLRWLADFLRKKSEELEG
jgi:COMPASS component SDC1